jgi:hypothetical protein
MRNQDRLNLSKKIVIDGANTYICSAQTAAVEADAVWQIKKVAVSGGTTVITWADGDDLFDNVATDPTGLDYA